MISPPLVWLGLALVVFGFMCHWLAARAIGGSYIAYRDHMFGFVLILLVTAAVSAGIGWKFWRGRRDITLLVTGVLQALLGIYVYLQRYAVHG
jgi:hypothetical protein